MSDPAVADSASLLFIAGTGLAGLGLGLLSDLLVRRILPQLAGAPSTPLRITTTALTFVLSALLGWRFGASPELAAYLVLVVTGVQLSRIDMFHHLLPDRLVLPLLAAGLVLLTVSAGAHGASENLLRGVAGAAILFVLYLFMALTSRNGLGMGDVKLAAPLGLYLGYLGWSQLFYGAALGFVAGGIASVVLVLKNRGNKPREVAYGPSMLAAGLAAILLLP
ncbi:A24 family peptidase [Arthrobacter sp. UYEF20]|uniref:prepilin peptidase n=1 Tax=Arthrobacter sp. UYEF20 TaxID=1756363 RepID=UPI003393D733